MRWGLLPFLCEKLKTAGRCHDETKNERAADPAGGKEENYIS